MNPIDFTTPKPAANGAPRDTRGDGEPNAPPVPRPVTPADVLASWLTEGPLVRVPTGFGSLDEACRGGFVYGRRHYLVGAPGAGKTALANVLARRFLNLGLVVGVLAIDEEPSDLTVRYAQMICGLSQHDCDVRDPVILGVAAEQLAPLRLRMYGEEFTIEGAAEDLASYAKSERCGAAFIVDSVQTARSDMERLLASADGAMSGMQAMDARVSAIRSVTTRHRFITIPVSEMNRGAYRSKDAAQNGNTMASAKGTGSVEYSAQVLLGVRSVKGEPDLVHVEIAKSRGGRAGGEFYLALDRARHELTETDAPAEPDGTAGDRVRLDGLVQAVRLAILERGPVAGLHAMRAALRERSVAFRNADLDVALVRLGPELDRGPSPNRPRWSLRTSI